jgi:hypothetical protein
LISKKALVIPQKKHVPCPDNTDMHLGDSDIRVLLSKINNPRNNKIITTEKTIQTILISLKTYI